MAKCLAVRENRKDWLTPALPDWRPRGAFQDDAVNATEALTAHGPVADWSSVALPIGGATMPRAFCRTLDEARAFFRFRCFPPLFTIFSFTIIFLHNIFIDFRRRSDFPRIFPHSGSKGHGADKFWAEFSAR